MSATNLTSRRTTREIIEDQQFKLDLYEMAFRLLGQYPMPTPTSILTRSQRLRVSDVALKTKADPEAVIRRGVDLFLAQEAPLYLKAARAQA